MYMFYESKKLESGKEITLGLYKSKWIVEDESFDILAIYSDFRIAKAEFDNAKSVRDFI